MEVTEMPQRRKPMAGIELLVIKWKRLEMKKGLGFRLTPWFIWWVV